VGIADALRGFWRARPSESAPLEDQIAWQGLERRLGIGDYLSIPAVARARQLITSLVSMLEPVSWRGGYPLPTEEQPRILERPQAEITRKEWLAQLTASLVDHGNAYLWIPESGRGSGGWPDVANVLPAQDVYPEWADASHFTRRYRWADRWLYPPRDIVHLAIDRPAGELVGRSPLETAGDALGRVLLADLYAAEWFETGSVPTVTLKYDDRLNATEAEAARQKFMNAHRSRSPAVLSKGWELQESTVSPEGSQLLETRKWGVQEVARVLGVFPAELLLAELSGSSLTYQNIAEALSTFVRVTVQPIYLDALESGLSELVPRTQTVRFNTAELERLGTAQRWAAYETGLRAGFLETPQIDRWEGWDRATGPQIPPQYAPTPAAPGATT
jgi:HK97 family phage portal protein